MAIHSTLVDLQNTFSNIQILAYLDDVFLVGLPSDVTEAFTSLQCNFPAIGLDIACQKCEIYCPSPAITIPDCQLPVTSEGIVILGMRLGNAKFVSNFCSTYGNTGEQLCDQLSSLNDVQSASLLLKYCHVPRLNYLARVVPPNLLTSAAEIHNSQTRKVFSEILSYHQLGDLAWQQATLPVRLGGFDLTSVKSIAACAFLASWVEAIDALPKRFPNLRVDLDLLLK